MSDNVTRLSLRDEQKALTRRRLIDAAESVFASDGFHGATVAKIAREAGATTGALYSSFASKEDLFLALFEERIATDVGDYSEIMAESTTLEEQVRRVGDHWMHVLRKRPHYFPLLIEFWTYAIREPQLRDRLGSRFAALRLGSARIASEGAVRWGLPVDAEVGERLGLFLTALGNGIALQKLVEPEAVPDELFGELLAAVFNAFEALVRESARNDEAENG